MLASAVIAPAGDAVARGCKVSRFLAMRFRAAVVTCGPLREKEGGRFGACLPSHHRSQRGMLNHLATRVAASSDSTMIGALNATPSAPRPVHMPTMNAGAIDSPEERAIWVNVIGLCIAQSSILQ
jgi:hypothetical protein